MTRRIFKIFVLLAVVMTGGCFNTEKEYEQLVAENKDLATDLQIVERENAILNQALDNINIEQETLQNILSLSRSMVPGIQNQAGISPPPAVPVVGVEDDYWVEPDTMPVAVSPRMPVTAQPAGNTTAGGIYVVLPGDVLSSIALAHNTTIDRLIELNPYLSNRNNFMIREKDKIRVP